MKKVYFACSIRGGRNDQPVYEEIVSLIKTDAIVLSEIFGDKSLTQDGHSNLSDRQIWVRDMAWLKEADAIVAEVTNPSLGVGYEIAKAEEMGKPILALHRIIPGKRLSAMVAGSSKVKVAEYQNVAELKSTISNFLAKI